MSLYDDLGVAPDATPEQLTAAYRRLSKQHHPDAGGDAEAFARVTHAASILRDPARRAQYDATGREDFREVAPDAEAFALLVGEFALLLGEFVSGALDGSVDLIARVKVQLNRAVKEHRAQADKMRAMARRLDDSAARLARKTSDADGLASLIADQARQLADLIGQIDAHLVNLTRAVELADDWDWRTDQRPPADASGWFSNIDPNASISLFHNGGRVL